MITFQGDEAAEMYFMKSGECRVVMEVHKEPKNAPRPLPQAAFRSSRSTKHDSCKQSFRHKDEQTSVQSTYLLTRAPSVPPLLSSKLPALSTKPKSIGKAVCPIVSKHSVNSKYISEPNFQPTSHRTYGAAFNTACTALEPSSSVERLSPQFSGDLPVSDEGCEAAFGMQQERHRNQSSCLSFISIPFSTDSHLRDSAQSQHQPKVLLQSTGKLKSLSPSYTLKSFLRDFEKRDSGKLIADLDFSDKQAQTWQTGTNLTGMLRGDISDAAFYQTRFETWARKVIEREKRLRAEAAIDQGFASNIPKDLMLNTWQSRVQKPPLAEV